jgi:hypothetical protein
MNHINYSRCKACNNKFYPSWDKAHNVYEELCRGCLTVARHAARTDTFLYQNSADRWGNETEKFICSYVTDKYGDSDSMLEDDPYYEFGEDAFGDLKLFDDY